MTAKQYLRQALKLNDRIEYDKAELMRLWAVAEAVPTIDFEYERVQTSPQNKTEDIILQIVSLEERIRGEVKELVELKDNIRGLIEEVPDDTERLVLQGRYLLEKGWDEIAEDLNYHVRSVYRIHGRALLHIDLTKLSVNVSKVI